MDDKAIKQALEAVAPGAVQETEYSARGYVLEVKVAPDRIVDAVSILDRTGFFIETITGVDWLGENAAKAKPAKKAKPAEGEPATAEAAEPEAPAGPPPVEEMEVVYDFNRYDRFCRVVVKARVPRDKAEIPTISGVFTGALWHERETHDFFGIKFLGHPYLVPLLLPEDADFHPLLKDFKP